MAQTAQKPQARNGQASKGAKTISLADALAYAQKSKTTELSFTGRMTANGNPIFQGQFGDESVELPMAKGLTNWMVSEGQIVADLEAGTLTCELGFRVQKDRETQEPVTFAPNREYGAL